MNHVSTRANLARPPARRPGHRSRANECPQVQACVWGGGERVPASVGVCVGGGRTAAAALSGAPRNRAGKPARSGFGSERDERCGTREAVESFRFPGRRVAVAGFRERGSPRIAGRPPSLLPPRHQCRTMGLGIDFHHDFRHDFHHAVHHDGQTGSTGRLRCAVHGSGHKRFMAAIRDAPRPPPPPPPAPLDCWVNHGERLGRI